MKVLAKIITPTPPPPLPEESKSELASPLRPKTKNRLNPEDPPSNSKLKLRHCATSISSLLRIKQISSISPINSPLIPHNLSNSQQKTLDPITDFSEKPIDLLVEVNTLTVGSSFGELALLSNKPRAATIICKEDCEFAVLEKVDFLKILKISEEKKLFEEMMFFANLSIFKGWNFNLVKMLYVNTHNRSCCLNEVVYQEGGESQEMFIVQKGSFVVKKMNKGRNEGNWKKWGGLKELFAGEGKYFYQESVKVF